MKILLVEDNVQLSNALTALLKRNSHLVDAAFDGEEALLYLRDYDYEVIVLDIMMPKIDGLEVLRRLRKAGNMTPVILLTAKSTLGDKIEGLDSGADDYLSKPFATEELLARIRALGRRKEKQIKKEEAAFGDFILQEGASSLSCGERSTLLSNKEMAILRLLMEAEGKLVSQEQIAKSAWESDAFSTNENVWVHISNLRKKLQEVGSKAKIKSIRYQGYYLEVEA